MSEYVAVDAKPVNLGGDVLLLGAAVDVKDGDKFRQYYFDTVEEFCREVGIDKQFNLLKNSEIKKSIPSYDLSEKRKEFFQKKFQTLISIISTYLLDGIMIHSRQAIVTKLWIRLI